MIPDDLPEINVKTKNFLSRFDFKSAFLYLGLAASLFVFALDSYNRIPLPLNQIKGNPEILRKNQAKWLPLQIGQVLTFGDSLRTDAESKVEMELAEDLRLRIGPDSEISGNGPKLYDKERKYFFELKHGKLMAAFSRHSAQREVLEVHTGSVVIRSKDAIFAIQKKRDGSCTAGVLKGSLIIYSANAKFLPVHIRQEKAEWSAGAIEVKTSPLSIQERRLIAEAYLLTARDPDIHKRQLEESRKAGSAFRHAYLVGDFFTTGQGYTESDFVDESGDRILELFYDLFMPGTFGGFYIATYNLDLQNFDSLTFDLRSTKKFPPPGNFRIEFKSGKRIARSLGFHHVPAEWTSYSVPLKITSPVPISEIVVVFTHDGVGAAKQGGIQLKNINLTANKKDKPE